MKAGIDFLVKLIATRKSKANAIPYGESPYLCSIAQLASIDIYNAQLVWLTF